MKQTETHGYDLVSSENRTTEISAGKEVLVIVSTLIVERASPRHAGNYSCMVAGKAKTTVAVHVLNGEYVLAARVCVVLLLLPPSPSSSQTEDVDSVRRHVARYLSKRNEVPRHSRGVKGVSKGIGAVRVLRINNLKLSSSRPNAATSFPSLAEFPLP